MYFKDLELDKFSYALGVSESSGSYSIRNSIGALGKYQFMPATIRDTANYLGEDPPTEQQFLKTPAIQERYFEAFTKNNFEKLAAAGLFDYIGQNITGKNRYKKTVKINIYGLLGGAHLGGVGGVKRLLLNGQDRHDGTGGSIGTYISDYIAKFSDKVQYKKKEIQQFYAGPTTKKTKSSGGGLILGAGIIAAIGGVILWK